MMIYLRVANFISGCNIASIGIDSLAIAGESHQDGLYQEQARLEPGGPRVPQVPHQIRREHDQRVVQRLQAIGYHSFVI